MVNKISSQEVMRDVSGFFSDEQLKAIYNNAESYRDKVLIRLLWKSGRRISEVLEIKKGDIDFDNAMILWTILKKRRSIKKWKPIDRWTLGLLSEYILQSKLEDSKYYLLHTGYPDKHMTRQRAFQIIRTCCKKAGIEIIGEKKPHPHHFRHTFSINIARKMKTPADVRKLQMLLEHSSLNTTEQYLQFSDLDLRDLIEEDAYKDNNSKQSD